MKVGNKKYTTVWMKNDATISIIDQRYLPHKFIIEDLHSVNEMSTAITDMHLRGAPAIGAAAAYGMYLAALEAASKPNFGQHLQQCATKIKATRPTAVNLQWAVDRQLQAIAQGNGPAEKIQIAKQTALTMAEEETQACRQIGLHGVDLIQQLLEKKKG